MVHTRTGIPRYLSSALPKRDLIHYFLEPSMSRGLNPTGVAGSPQNLIDGSDVEKLHFVSRSPKHLGSNPARKPTCDFSAQQSCWAAARSHAGSVGPKISQPAPDRAGSRKGSSEDAVCSQTTSNYLFISSSLVVLC